MSKALFLLLCVPVSCQSQQLPTYLAYVDSLAAKYESGEISLAERSGSLTITIAAYGPSELPELCAFSRKSTNEFTHRIIIGSIGIMIRQAKEKSDTIRYVLADSLVELLGYIKSFELVPLIFSEIRTLNYDAIPFLITKLNNENQLVRRWCQEFLVNLSGQEKLRSDVDTIAGGREAQVKWVHWWQLDGRNYKRSEN